LENNSGKTASKIQTDFFSSSAFGSLNEAGTMVR